MQRREIIKKCCNLYQGNESDFANILKVFLDLDRVLHMNYLSRIMGYAPHTVIMWSKGFAILLPHIRLKIIQNILRGV